MNEPPTSEENLLTGPWRRREGWPPSGAGMLAMLLAGASALTLGALLLATACSSPSRRVSPYDEALRQVSEQRGQLGWDGLTTGMTRDEVERAVGKRLRTLEGPGPLCGRYTTRATVLGQALELDFAGPTQAARLASITVLLEAPPSGFRLDDVKPALEARLGNLTFVPSRHAPDLREDQLEKPLYRTAGDGMVFVNPSRGISLGDVCVD